MSGGTTLTSEAIAGAILATKLMNRVAQHYKRTGRQPDTLNLSRSEYQLLMATSTLLDVYGTSARAKPGKPTWRGYKLRVRNYAREKMAKERLEASGTIRIRRPRARKLNILGLYGLSVTKSSPIFDTSV